ncbi:porin [Chitinophaga lutea]|uniref:Porin n=1 Tax=Chitinophaga lutea TaxID=2488634 RepID=A0A3N4Q1C1_9BACT|nr:porin [Chitinophaga lutea]RPE13385.1 porin [Chitinophaga lutea]
MKKSLFALLAVCSAMSVSAQDSTRLLPVGFKLSGSADVYYKYNLNENATDGKTSFTNTHNSFELNMISLKLESSFKNVGLVADLGFGKRAEDFSYNDDRTRFAIKQLYISYAPASWLKFTMGSYSTHVGYELVDAYANRNYSMSYMFSYGPFFHTGVKADMTFGSHNFMVGVFNPTDFKSAAGWGGIKYVGAQYGFAPAEVPFKFYLNYIGGIDTLKTRNDQLDAVITYQVSPKFSLGYNGTVSMYKNKPDDTKGNWFGSALYLSYDPVESFGLTLRGEYLSDKDGKKFYSLAEYPEGGNVFALTLSGQYKIGGFTLIPEVRMDMASEDAFMKKAETPKSNSANVLLAAIYKF